MARHGLATWPSSVRRIRAGEQDRELRSETEVEVGDEILLRAWNRPEEIALVRVVAAERFEPQAEWSTWRTLTYELAEEPPRTSAAVEGAG